MLMDNHIQYARVYCCIGPDMRLGSGAKASMAIAPAAFQHGLRGTELLEASAKVTTDKAG